MKKMAYNHPDIDVVILSVEDILATSEDDDKNQGEWDEVFSEK